MELIVMPRLVIDVLQSLEWSYNYLGGMEFYLTVILYLDMQNEYVVYALLVFLADICMKAIPIVIHCY